MASGSIVLANLTNVSELSYTILGVASGNPVVCSGTLGNVPAGSPASGYPNQATCAVSGYDLYTVAFDYFGNLATTGSVQAKPGQTVSLSAEVS